MVPLTGITQMRIFKEMHCTFQKLLNYFFKLDIHLILDQRLANFGPQIRFVCSLFFYMACKLGMFFTFLKGCLKQQTSKQ